MITWYLLQFLPILKYIPVVSAFPSYDDRYQVILHEYPLNALTNNDNETSLTNDILPEYKSDNFTDFKVNCYDVEFQCMIPNVKKNDDFITSNNINPTQFEEKNEAIQVIKNFTTNYRGIQIGLKTGFWDYMITFDYNIYQYHIVSNTPDDPSRIDFLLASWSDKGDDDLFQMKPKDEIDTNNTYLMKSNFELITQDDGTRFVTQRIGNGEICDVTGLPRTTTINYICNHEVPLARINDVSEWRTCEYIIEVQSSWFCNYSMWTVPKAFEKHNINCYPEVQLRKTLNLNSISLEPLASGIFLGRFQDKSVFNVVLTKKYNFWNEESELDFQKFLGDLSLAFQFYIRNKLLLNPKKTETVFTSDTFQIIAELYDADRVYVGNIRLDQDENGFLVSYFTDEEVTDTNFLSYKRYEHISDKKETTST